MTVIVTAAACVRGRYIGYSHESTGTRCLSEARDLARMLPAGARISIAVDGLRTWRCSTGFALLEEIDGAVEREELARIGSR